MKYACLVILMTSTAILTTTSADSVEWWEGHWKPESARECATDGGMLYKPDEYQAWEMSCKIKKQQSIKDVGNVRILDLNSCNEEGEKLPDRRHILLRLDDGRLVANGKVFQKCLPGQESTPATVTNQPASPITEQKTLCPPELSVFESEGHGTGKGVKQELTVDLGRATLKEYRESKLAWVANGGMSCTNGSWVCHLVFENNISDAGEETETIAFDVVKDDAGNALALVAPGWGQNLYWYAQRNANRNGGGYNGGLIVEWFNGFSPDPQVPNGIPASVFSKASCLPTP